MKLSKVNCQYGAPMGRCNIDITNAGPVKLHLERVLLDSGGYDSGGAYWGLSYALKLYRYYWTGNIAKAPTPIIEGFVWGAIRLDAKNQIKKTYPQATFYR